MRRARPAEQNPKKGEKGVARSSRAPPPGHARPRGWARWDRPRVVGQGVRGSTPPCRAPRAACGLKRPKRKKGGLRSQCLFHPTKHRRAPPAGHARPRGWARWNRPRVVGQGASGSPPSCRAPPRVACGPKIKKGSERVRAVQMLTKSVLHIPGRARRRGWAHWSRARVVGWGSIGSPRSCRAPRAACGPERPNGADKGLEPACADEAYRDWADASGEPGGSKCVRTRPADASGDR